MTTRSSALSARLVVGVAFATEGALLLIAMLWAHWRGLHLPFGRGFESLLYGAGAALPLLALNFLLMRAAVSGGWRMLKSFLDEAIIPICRPLGPVSAAAVALSAGLAEELFFRGVLNTELSSLLSAPVGIAAASALFGAVHFLGRLKAYCYLVGLYFLFGVYFSLLTLWLQDLTPAIVCHALYNYLAILYVHYRYGAHGL
jgi:uncharacterized protein